jgi:predicted flavoprotein YhiN
VQAGLLREGFPGGLAREAGVLAAQIKAVPIGVTGTTGMARAISSAGGLPLDALDEGLMLRRRPGVFACGEMLDWEAPTGGYLLTACLATGRAAGQGAAAWLAAGGRLPLAQAAPEVL